MRILDGGITIDRTVRKSKVQQHLRRSCDINEIMRKAKEGVMPSVNGRTPMYADVSGVPDYQAALMVVENGNKAFMSLPAKVRQRFGNSPVEFIQALQDGARRQELMELGILKTPSKGPEEAKKEEKKEGEPAKAGAKPQQ